jgi:predicted  nucleic acid-binding Zn-ribbon protein
MSETVSLERTGSTLRELQAGQRSIYIEKQQIRTALNEAITHLMQRIGSLEAHIEDQRQEIVGRLEQLAAAAIDGPRSRAIGSKGPGSSTRCWRV